MLLLLPSALAFSENCGWPRIGSSVPDDDAVEVPLDVRPAIVFDWYETCWMSDASLRLLKGDEVVAETSFLENYSYGGEEHALTLPEPLDVGTDYLLHLDGEEGDWVSFRTGSTRVVGLSEVPVLERVSSTYNYWSQDAEVSFRARAADDPDGLSILQVREGVGDGRYSVRVEDEVVEQTYLSLRGAAPVCLEVRQVDGAGRPTAWSDPMCEERTCAVGGRPGAALAMGALAALLGRRRV